MCVIVIGQNGHRMHMVGHDHEPIENHMPVMAGEKKIVQPFLSHPRRFQVGLLQLRICDVLGELQDDLAGLVGELLGGPRISRLG